MNLHRVLIVSFALIACGHHAATAEEPAKRSPEEAKARGQLVGIWKGYVVLGKGEKPNEGPAKMELTITTERIAGIQLQEKERVDHGSGEYALTLSAEPRTHDGIKTNERGRKDTWLGIYTLEGETLKWCVHKKERPETFETGAGKFLMILKRESVEAPK